MARTVAGILALAFLAVWAGLAQAPKTSVVVVELFTSEACSSCPPADEILAQLDAPSPPRGKRRAPSNVQVIALGEHVDYWDHLDWRDRFASPLFSARQQEYGIAFNDASVYTPQAVVQGFKAVLGSDRYALNNAIREAAALPAAEVGIWPAIEGNVVHLRAGKLPPGSHAADVLLAVAESNLTNYVAGGENKGRRLTHAAVVRSMSRLGVLDPARPGTYEAQARLNLQPDWNRANLKVVLLVQDRENRRILGAAAARLGGS
jgi:hypothetical protein